MTSAAPTRKTSAPRKRGDDTRAKIIDETVNCIVEEGFPAATAKHVAERAGVTWGVIQYHFGDRNGLLMAVVDDGVAKLVESLSTADVGDLALPQRIETVVDIAWR
jgi:AcrR family transcriptional regulator